MVDRLRWQYIAAAALVVAIAAGFAVWWFSRTTEAERLDAERAPSVQQFNFPMIVPVAPVPAPTRDVVVEAASYADPRAAVSTYLSALSAGDAEASFQLLGSAARKEVTDVKAWKSLLLDRPRPLTFSVTSGNVQGDVARLPATLTYEPTIDPRNGFIPGRTAETYVTQREGGRWLVNPVPASVNAQLPPDTAAAPVVDAWLERLRACDATGAAKLQVPYTLVGDDVVAGEPCARKGTWTAGPVERLQEGPEVQPFLAAYGSGPGSWARLVTITGPDRTFRVGIAPLGDVWRIFGVLDGAGV